MATPPGTVWQKVQQIPLAPPVWVPIGSFAQGVKGDTGPAGAPGARGETGPPGIVADLASELSGPITDNGDSKGEEIWLMATHQSIDQNMYVLGSVDGVHFQYLRKDSIYPQAYATRDPNIIKWKGVYYLAFTNAGNTFFTILSSLDLWNWTKLVDVDCTGATSNVFHCWAPQFFADTDGSLTIFFSLSHDSVDTNHQLYYTTPMTSDLSVWSVPLAVGGSVFPVSSIDPCVVKNGSVYTLFFKNDVSGHRYIQYATSTSRTSGYSVQTTDDTLGFGIDNEAPEVHRVDANTWRIYYNNVSGLNSVNYYYRETPNSNFPFLWGSANPIVAPFIAAHSGLIRVQDVPTMRNMLGSFLSANFPRGSQVLLTSSQAITSGATAVISWTSAGRDELAAWNSATKLIAPHSGWYMLGAHVKWASASGGKRVMDIRLNGSVFAGSVSQASVTDSPDPDLSIALPTWLSTGDYYETSVFQNQGGSVNVTAAQMFMLEM